MRCAILLGLASCSFDHGALPAGSGGMVVDDSAQELAAGTATDLEIDPLGYLAPDAFVGGGLHARGYLSVAVTATTTWADLTDAALGPIAGERYAEPPTSDWFADRPYGLGIGRADHFTVVYDGEIYLDGPVELQLAADDVGFLEIQLDAVAVTLRASYGAPSPVVSIAPRTPGWYPIRGAVTEGVGYAAMILQTVTGGIATRVDPSRLRAHVTAAPGLIVSAAQSRVFAAPILGEAVEPSLIDRDFGASPPGYDFYGLYGTEYGLRYAGQLRIDHDGLYGFTVSIGTDVGDYARLMIDGQTVAGHWPGQVDQAAKPDQALTAGWHDVIFDYAQRDGGATVELDLVTPGGSGPIPGDHLRPVRTGGAIAYASGGPMILADATMAQPGVTTVPLVITAPPDAMVDFVDLRFTLAGETRADLAVALALGTAVDPMPLPATPAYDAGAADYLGAHTALAGADPAATWNAVFTDSVPGGPIGQVTQEDLVVSYHGGPVGPWAQHMTYISAVHPTPGATALGPITVTGELHGAALQIEVRTSGDWVTVESGAVPAIDAGDAVQYRLTVTGDGWQAPTIDRIEVDYTTS